MKLGSIMMAVVVLSGVLFAAGKPQTEQPPRISKDSFANVKMPKVDDAKVRELLKTDHIKLLEKAQENYKKMGIKDYTCEFVKKERVKGWMKDKQHMKTRFRDKPFSVSFEWIVNSPQADAMLYVEGKYKDKDGKSQMLVRPRDALARVIVGDSLLKAPDCNEAKRSSLRPCTKFGINNLMSNLLDIYRKSTKNGECKISDAGDMKSAGRDCYVLKRELPGRKYKTSETTYIFLDKKTLLPVKLVGYDHRGKLWCEYEYLDINFNAGLEDKDFTPEANKIAPPKKK